jgi:hypothetical protein
MLPSYFRFDPSMSFGLAVISFPANKCSGPNLCRTESRAWAPPELEAVTMGHRHELEPSAVCPVSPNYT